MDEDACSICLCDYEVISRLENCMHSFCYQCIIDWYSANPHKKCPMCMQPSEKFLFNIQWNESYDEYNLITGEITTAPRVEEPKPVKEIDEAAGFGDEVNDDNLREAVSHQFEDDDRKAMVKYLREKIADPNSQGELQFTEEEIAIIASDIIGTDNPEAAQLTEEEIILNESVTIGGLCDMELLEKDLVMNINDVIGEIIVNPEILVVESDDDSVNDRCLSPVIQQQEIITSPNEENNSQDQPNQLDAVVNDAQAEIIDNETTVPNNNVIEESVHDTNDIIVKDITEPIASTSQVIIDAEKDTEIPSTTLSTASTSQVIVDAEIDIEIPSTSSNASTSQVVIDAEIDNEIPSTSASNNVTQSLDNENAVNLLPEEKPIHEQVANLKDDLNKLTNLLGSVTDITSSANLKENHAESQVVVVEDTENIIINPNSDLEDDVSVIIECDDTGNYRSILPDEYVLHNLIVLDDSTENIIEVSDNDDSENSEDNYSIDNNLVREPASTSDVINGDVVQNNDREDTYVIENKELITINKETDAQQTNSSHIANVADLVIDDEQFNLKYICDQSGNYRSVPVQDSDEDTPWEDAEDDNFNRDDDQHETTANTIESEIIENDTEDGGNFQFSVDETTAISQYLKQKISEQPKDIPLYLTDDELNIMLKMDLFNNAN